jgi:hypothetical protein
MSIKIYRKNNFVVVDEDNSSIKYLASQKADFDDVEDSGFVVWNVDNSKEVYSFVASELEDENGVAVGNKAAVLEYLSSNINFKTGNVYSESITSADIDTLSHFIYNPVTDKLEADRAIETTLNSLFLGEQHKMSSGAENIFFTNLGNNTNFYPMWGGLKDQSLTVNQGSSGFIPPSGRVYTDMFSLPLGGNATLNNTGYSGDNYFGVNIAGLGITTTAGENVPSGQTLVYNLYVNGKQVYKQILPENHVRVENTIYAGDVIEWWFDHPVEIHAGTTIFAEIRKVDRLNDIDYGVFQVRQGDELQADGNYRYQAVVHNRLFEDKDLELISPYLKYQAMDFGLDSTGSTILLRDLSLGTDNLLVPHAVNTLEAIADGTKIKIKIKGGAKIIVESLPVNAVSINGAFVNSVLNQAVVQLNSIFTNTSGFASDDTFVDSFTLSGNDLTLGLNDGVSYTVDVTTLGVDENKFVTSATLSGNIITLSMSDATSVFIDAAGLAIDNDTTITSGSVTGDTLNLTKSDGSIIAIDASLLGGSSSLNVVSGSVFGDNLVLVMSDASTISIDASNMINGSSGLASNSGWNISYGTNANDVVGTSTNDSTVNQQLPFYFGQSFGEGDVFSWNFQSNGGGNLILGIWDGAESPVAYNGGANTASNWGTNFTYAGGFIDGSNSTLTNTTNGSKYIVTNGDALEMRFDNLGFLTLVDVSVSPEVEIAKTTIALGVTEFNIQMYTWANGVLPNGIISTGNWTVVHDFDNDEDGIVNGIQDHTVIKSNISIEKGEKIMFMLDELGGGDFFGTNYTAASSGVATAEEQLDNEFKYETNEALDFEVNGVSDWNVNTNATYYFNNGAGGVGYRKGGANTIQGMFSMRFNDDGKLTIYSEDNQEKVATAKSDPTIGSSVNLYYGVKGNRAYYSIPVISKQSINGGSQPDVNFVPTVANQTVSVAEAEVLNFQIISSDNIVNQFVEVDAPSWMSLNQNSGILSGTAPAYLGTSADTIVVNCKAGNAVGGNVDFTVTVTVAEVAYTNSKSLSFNGSSSLLQGNPINVSVLNREIETNPFEGTITQAGTPWTISMWVKPDTLNPFETQTLMVYGALNDYNNGAITIKQSSTTLVFNYGTVYDNIILVAANSFVDNTWQHVMITYDGGDTGAVANQSAAYYGRFNIFVDGVNKFKVGVATNGGYAGAIDGTNQSDNIFRFGKANNVHNNYFDGIMNQMAIWGSNETANIATIYNNGATQDLSLLSSAPVHYYEIETGVTTITDIAGNADLTGYNFIAANLVSDTP